MPLLNLYIFLCRISKTVLLNLETLTATRIKRTRCHLLQHPIFQPVPPQGGLWRTAQAYASTWKDPKETQLAWGKYIKKQSKQKRSPACPLRTKDTQGYLSLFNPSYCPLASVNAKLQSAVEQAKHFFTWAFKSEEFSEICSHLHLRNTLILYPLNSWKPYCIT